MKKTVSFISPYDDRREGDSVNNVRKPRKAASFMAKFLKSYGSPSSIQMESIPDKQDMDRDIILSAACETGVSNFPADNTELYQSADDECSDEDEAKCHVNSAFEDDEEDFIFVPNLAAKYEISERGNATDIKLSPNGKILLTDFISGVVFECDKKGKKRAFLQDNDVIEPWATASFSDESIAVTSRKAQRVFIFSKEGEFESSLGKDFFQCPCGIAVDKYDRVIVTDSMAGEVSVHERTGSWLFNIGDNVPPVQQFSNPQYVHVTIKNDIIVSDTGKHSIKIFNDKGEFQRSFGRFGKEDGCFKSPYAVCSDNLGQLIVADHYNDRVSLFTGNGDFIRHLLTSSDGLLHPQGVTLSGDMKLYVTHGRMKANKIVVYRFSKKLKNHTETITNYPILDD